MLNHVDFPGTITWIKGAIFASTSCYWPCCQGKHGQSWNAFANGSLWWGRTNVFTPHASLTVPEPLSPMVHHTEAVDAWNLKPPRIQLGVLSRHTSCNAVSTQERVYQTATYTHTLSQCSFCQVHHATLRLLPHAIPISCGIHKKFPKQNPCGWWPLRVSWGMLLAGLCHMAFETPRRMPKSGISPKSPDWCVPELFSICPSLLGEPGEFRFFGVYQPNP